MDRDVKHKGKLIIIIIIKKQRLLLSGTVPFLPFILSNFIFIFILVGLDGW